MSTELATYQPGSLVIAAEQTTFTDEQTKALEHIGVQDASNGDLRVFFHVCQRTGLDPFARQIYMIGRKSGERQPDGSWVDVVKQTIQTGIDGFRLIGRRAADQRGESISVEAPEWAHPDGSWRPVWSREWGHPVAARVTIRRGGEPFTATALFDEYAQTKRNGDLTQMWSQRPAGQIAKCAEALAWRMAFPQDLSGIYTDDETAHASNPQPVAEQVAPADLLAAQVADEETFDGEVVEDGVTSGQLKALGAAMRDAGLTERADALLYVNDLLQLPEPITSRSDLSRDQASRVLDALRQDVS